MVLSFLIRFTAIGDHFYTTDPRGELAPSSGYEREGIAFYAYPNQQPGTVPLFRLFGNGNHFYTTSSVEVDNATNAGYAREGEFLIALLLLLRKKSVYKYLETS